MQAFERDNYPYAQNRPIIHVRAFLQHRIGFASPEGPASVAAFRDRHASAWTSAIGTAIEWHSDSAIRMFCGDKINFQHAPARTTLHLSSARQLGGFMGRASRLKQERKSRLQDGRLLMTLTNEPFQPVRLYYSIPDPAWVCRGLSTLECLVEAPEEQCWQWLFHAEAASLRFGGGYEDVPKERRPIILGRIRFPDSSSMIIQTNSIARAIGAARFFAPYLGTECTAIRCRLVNRLFAGEEGRLEELMKSLDQNVTVIDPRAAEAAFAHQFEHARTKEDLERVAASSLERRLKSREDVPLVEDLPLAPGH